MAETKPNTAAAEAHATKEGLLDTNQMALIGTMGTEIARRALIRLPSGRIRQVTVGDTLRGRRIDAIQTDRLFMSRNGQQSILEMPQG